MSTAATSQPFGFMTKEITTSEPTRSARLKWVVIVNGDLPPGRQVNAAVCVAASTAHSVVGLLGPEGVDGDGVEHAGLPWAGCTILSATPEQLVAVREKASATEGVLLIDMPEAAQSNRVYDEYLDELARTPGRGLEALAVSLVGLRKDIERITRKLSLLA
ncbi:DUF2000 domain-containing protein [Plantibacter sp. YIM 135347]|uniref:DUF2000 domain-containing protein n=1 Tax=Plantibacter sp. YIM 135347 TaxID=3423919 RepID=UPI003D3411CD